MENLRGILVFAFFFIWIEDRESMSKFDYFIIYIIFAFSSVFIIIGVLLVTEIKEIKLFGLERSYGNYNDSL